MYICPMAASTLVVPFNRTLCVLRPPRGGTDESKRHGAGARPVHRWPVVPDPHAEQSCDEEEGTAYRSALHRHLSYGPQSHILRIGSPAYEKEHSPSILCALKRRLVVWRCGDLLLVHL